MTSAPCTHQPSQGMPPLATGRMRSTLERAARVFREEEHLTQLLASGREWTWRNRGLLGLVLGVGSGPQFGQRVLGAAFGERDPCGRGAALDVDLLRPVRLVDFCLAGARRFPPRRRGARPGAAPPA